MNLGQESAESLKIRYIDTSIVSGDCVDSLEELRNKNAFNLDENVIHEGGKRLRPESMKNVQI